MSDFSPGVIGTLLFLGLLCLVAAYYYGSEKKRLEFLSDRLRTSESEGLEKNSRKAKLAEKLLDLGSPIEVEKLLQISYAIIVGGLLFGFAVDAIPFGILFAIIGYKFPDIYIARKKSVLDAEFEKQLPECIDTLYAVLKAGQTATQGYKVLSEDAPFPSNFEFGRVYNDIQTGATQKDALGHFYERHPLNDLKLFMTGMIVASEAGPAVAINTLHTISTTIRNRDAQKKSTKSAVMQGKVTLYIMSGLPLVVLAGMLTFAGNGYAAPLTQTTMGFFIMATALVLDALGYIVASKITNTTDIVKY